jgi:UDP-glucose 4-epimerase
MPSTPDVLFDAYAGARAVITGRLGLIGSALARRLLELGAEVLLVDSMIPEYGGNLANIACIRDTLSVNIADIRGGYALRHLLSGQDFLFNLVSEFVSEWLYYGVDTLRKGQANLLMRSCTEAM